MTKTRDRHAADGARAFQASGTPSTVLLRALATAIAIAAVVDPAITVTGAARARVAIVNLDPASAEAARVRASLVAGLEPTYDVAPRIDSDVAAAVLVGRGYPAVGAAEQRAEGNVSIPDSLIVATVTMPDDRAVRIARVSAPRDVPAATAIHVDIDLEARGAAAHTTDVVARLGGLETARVSHRWTAVRERWRASFDVVPVGDPPFVVRLDAGGDSADVVVGLRTEPLRVEFYDPRPSWATTFIRRALEADARFQVESLSFSSRGVAARTAGDVPLTDSRVASFDALVVGGLERLSAADVRALDRYMVDRGGAVVLAPDARVDTGPARELLPETIERLLEQPATLVSTTGPASLRASELLVFRGQTVPADVVAATPGTDAAPVIISMARGAGRLLASGAMDAWRFRAADRASFDRFWQSVIAGLASAAPPPLDVDVAPGILRPGEAADVVVRARGEGVAAVSATIDGQPIRLWPDAERGVFRGRIIAAKPGSWTIEAHAEGTSDRTGSRMMAVTADAEHARGAVAPALSMLAASHAGIDVAPDRLADLERFVRESIHAPRVPVERRPMRSTWWLVPFTAALSAEWWLRRRRGLR
jgi:hypothetical protein